MKIKERNEIKRARYALCMDKYRSALSAKCYFECILIDYAMIEDRLLSVMEHTGFVSRNSEAKASWSRRNVDERRLILATINQNYAVSAPSLSTISIKVSFLKALCATRLAHAGSETLFARWIDDDVRIILEENGAANLLDRVDAWRDSRNVYVHALFGNVAYSVDDNELKCFAEQGYGLAREIDKLVSRLRYAEKRLEKRRVVQLRHT